MSRTRFTDDDVRRAAAELASQERYNPAWCKPGDMGNHSELYQRRARLILEAALTPDSSQCRCSPEFRHPKGNGTCATCGGWLPGEQSMPLTRIWSGE